MEDVEKAPFRGIGLVSAAFAAEYPFRREVEGLIALHRTFRDVQWKQFDSTGDGDSVTDFVVRTETIRVLNSVEAVIALALDGYGAQAQMLLRPTFESLVNGWWASRHPDVTEANHLLHRKYLIHLDQQSRREHPIVGSSSDIDPMTDTDLERATTLFGRWAERPWSGVSLRKMAEEYVTQSEGPAGPHLRAYLAVIHPMVNRLLHSGGLSIMSVTEWTDEGAVLRMGPWEGSIWEALRDAYNHLVGALDMFATHFDVADTAEVRRAVFNGWAGFRDPDELARVRRNDPCLCTSGAKYKYCHGSLLS